MSPLEMHLSHSHGRTGASCTSAAWRPPLTSVLKVSILALDYLINLGLTSCAKATNACTGTEGNLEVHKLHEFNPTHSCSLVANLRHSFDHQIPSPCRDDHLETVSSICPRHVHSEHAIVGRSCSACPCPSTKHELPQDIIIIIIIDSHSIGTSNVKSPTTRNPHATSEPYFREYWYRSPQKSIPLQVRHFFHNFDFPIITLT